MENKKTGGPAFPEISGYKIGDGAQEKTNCVSGMALRDYFAAKAMQSLLTLKNPVIGGEEKNGVIPVNKLSYMVADAMLAERDK
jgi:hypothetical protein